MFLRLIQIRIATPSLAKISATCQINLRQARVADSSSTKHLSFHVTLQRNAARRRDVRQQSRLFIISLPKRHLRHLEFQRNTAA
jgi:hypothetical protein